MKNLITIIFVFILSILAVYLTEDDTIIFTEKKFEYILKAIENIQDLQDEGHVICIMALDEQGDWNRIMEDFRFIGDVLDLYEKGTPGACDYVIVATHGVLDEQNDDSNDLLKGKTKDLPRITTWFTTQCRTNRSVKKSEKHLIPYERDRMMNWEEEKEEAHVVYNGVKDFPNTESSFSLSVNLKNYIRGENKKCSSFGCLFEEDYMISSGVEKGLRKAKTRYENKLTGRSTRRTK